jgi:putative membrane-bound dehydrogenase-like protein
MSLFALFENPFTNRALLVAGPLIVLICARVTIADDNFRGGAAAVDITPEKLPSIIAGGFLEGRATEVRDRLYARSVVLDDGKTKLALTIVDTCMMTQELIDQAKTQASRDCGIPVEQIMVSATHTHSAPAAMGCLGTRQDQAYAKWLPDKIAESIVAAHARLEPARIGWASIDDWEHTHNRRWIRKPENMIGDPFGGATGRAHMHPGYQSPHVIGPSGPVDPGLSVLSLQSKQGRPLAVIANYSQHYFGAPAISADYYGRFSKYIAELLDQPGGGNGPFVCAMSQGTSGDLMWMDYGSPNKQPTMDRYAEAVALVAEQALATIEYHDDAPLAIVEKRLQLEYRVPDQARLEWARPIAAKIENDLPKNIPEVYAREALILHQRQRTEIKLQAIRIGDLTISTLPNEVYALTGLKLKAQAPLATHFNIELANGAEGYIPPPEQHALGGYTTWPARTAGLEVEAEPKIVATLLAALEEVTGKSRKEMVDQHGPYANAILKSSPVSYWRLNEAAGSVANNAVTEGISARLLPGFAWYLPGVASGSGIGQQEHLTNGAFSGPNQINRAVHLAGGSIQADLPELGKTASIALWFWLGEPSGASRRSGNLVTLPDGPSLIAIQDENHRAQLQIGEQLAEVKLAADDWNFAVLVCDEHELRLHINGETQPALTVDRKSVAAIAKTKTESNGGLTFGSELQGKLDEIAVWNRALTAAETNDFWQVSGVPAARTREIAERQRIAQEYAERIKPPKFSPDYAAAIEGLRPMLALSLNQQPEKLVSEGAISFANETFATFQSGRLESHDLKLGDAYSVSVWFRCETANDVQPVTAYFFSLGADGDKQAPGDHLGIGGIYQPDLIGKLLFFNGNQSAQVIAGKQVIPPQTWNHVVLVRDGKRVRAFLNGEAKPEFDGEIAVTADAEDPLFFGSRSDHFAPLNGQLAWLALFDRALTNDEAKQLHSASGQKVGTPRNVPEIQQTPLQPDCEPLSTIEAIRSIHLPEGYRVELVAAEPQLFDPVAFDWDEAGRLWVVEMADYPLGIDGAGKAGGRIRVLQDVDGDGDYEQSTLFADNLSFPNGILTWRDGVLVTAAPEILFLRDSDGDGRADQREVLLTGFNEGNQQLRVNGLRWGLDGWVYCANGGHHAGYGAQTQVRSLRSGKAMTIGSRDFRFQPETGELELESGPSQFGRNRDAWGHWFGTQNANPLWHYVISDRYLARNPHVPAPQPIRHIVGPGSPKVFPASQLEKRYHSFEQSGRFTSACGAMIYGDDWLFGVSSDEHAFTCEPFHNLVQHNVLSDAGVSYVARRAAGEDRFDFFASEDRWCRPVMTRTGPDGGLWVADMYRYMIEHPDWLPKAGKDELLPHYRLGEDRGRIYRVVPIATGRRTPLRLDRLELRELVAALDSPNDWQRDKVQQMLLWKNDPAAIPLLEQLAQTGSLPQTRVQALFTLDEFGALKVPILISALADASPRVRELSVLLSETRKDDKVIAAATALARDPDAKVRLQLALTCGQWQSESAGRALSVIAAVDADDPLMVAAVMSSTAGHLPVFLPELLRSDPQVQSAFRESLLRQALGSGSVDAIAIMLDDALQGSDVERSIRLSEFLLALERVGSSLDRLAAEHADLKLRSRIDAANAWIGKSVSTIHDPSTAAELRLAAATLLTRLPDYREQAVSVLAENLQPNVDADLQATVILRIAQSAADRVPDLLTEHWNGLSPALRTKALDAWMSRTNWTEDLLLRIERGDLARSSLDLSQQSRLTNHPKASIKELARRILKSENGASAQELLLRYRSALELPGDQDRGRASYLRNCANCHRRGDVGADVGPNLASVISHSPEKLLTNILDPNADIQPGYQAYSCVLTTGEVLAGLLSNETANSLTILQANGQNRTVSRNEIEELSNLGISLMPEGLQATLTPQDIADLIAFLKSPLVSELQK